MTLISGFNSYTAQLALQQQLQTQRRPQPDEQQEALNQANTNNNVEKRDALFRSILEDDRGNASGFSASGNGGNRSQEQQQSQPSQGRGSILDVSA